MLVQSFFKFILEMLIGFRLIQVVVYYFAFGWPYGLIEGGFLLFELFFYKKKVYNNVTESYIAFNILTIVDVLASVVIFGNGLGFEFYTWVLLAGALYIPFTNNLKIRGVMALIIVIFWEIIAFTPIEPLIPVDVRWHQMFFFIFNDIYCFLMFFAFAYVNERYLRRTEESLAENRFLANYDQLTNVLNRRGLEESFRDKEDAKASIALCDIDDFKKVNDSYGHSTGDFVLQQVARCFLRFSEDSQVVRWGGEEFLIYMENISIEQATAKINNVLGYLHGEKLLPDNQMQITFTAGIAEISGRSELDSGVERADTLLYEGKRDGKNRVVAERR